MTTIIATSFLIVQVLFFIACEKAIGEDVQKDKKKLSETKQEKEFTIEISAKESYVLYEPIFILVNLKNITNKEKECYGLSGKWVNSSILNFEIENVKSNITIPYDAISFGRIPTIGEGPTRIKLMPNNSNAGEFDLSRYSNITDEGDYFISAIHFYNEGSNKKSILSNKIKISIRKQSKIDKTVIKEYLNYKGREIDFGYYRGKTYFENMGFEEKYIEAINKINDSVYIKYLTYNLSEYYFDKKDYSKSLLYLNKVKDTEFSLADDILLLKAKCYLKLNKQKELSEILASIVDKYPFGNCMKEAKDLQNKLRNKKKL